ncbi:hypothetical protein ALC57_13217, partial [Trachymyrmex cornetzi]
IATLAECFAWLQRCDECIERLEELCRAKRAVINSNHIEPRQFLEDTGNIVFGRVRDAVERHDSVKVNTAFNGEFATKDKRANKSIITKNIEIYRCTDICEWCLHYFGSSQRLQTHEVDCQKLNDCTIRLPSENDRWLEFSNHRNQERVPFIVYADLKCVLRKTEPDKVDVSTSYAYQRHEAFNIGYYVHCSYDNSLSSYQFRRDNDCITWFARQLNDLAHRVKDIIPANVPMETLSKQQQVAYRTATRCHICGKLFAPDDTRVRDHCHLTGRYRGPAHSNCNLNYKNSLYIPVVFHNLSGYDAHFIIKEIATAYNGNVDLLPITKEKYISFTKHVDSTKDKNEKNFQKNCVKLRFIDSFKFLSASLDKLLSYFDKDKLKIVRSEFLTLSDEEIELLTRKGVFPYEYIDCTEKLQDTRIYCTRERLRSRCERMAAILHSNARRVQRSVLENRCLVIS